MPETSSSMSDQNHLKLAELISARLCQSIIGPLGALANGIEILRSGANGRLLPEMTRRLDYDCDRLLDRVMFIRLAYGSCADDIALSLADLRSMAIAFFGGTSITIDWPQSDGSSIHDFTLERGAARVLINGMLVVAECLGMRGTITVRWTGDRRPTPSELQVLGIGQLIPTSAAKCRTLKSDVRIAYLDDQTIHPFLARQIAQSNGIGFTVAVGPHRILASILLPRETEGGAPIEDQPARIGTDQLSDAWTDDETRLEPPPGNPRRP